MGGGSFPISFGNGITFRRGQSRQIATIFRQAKFYCWVRLLDHVASYCSEPGHIIRAAFSFNHPIWQGRTRITRGHPREVDGTGKGRAAESGVWTLSMNSVAVEIICDRIVRPMAKRAAHRLAGHGGGRCALTPCRKEKSAASGPYTTQGRQ